MITFATTQDFKDLNVGCAFDEGSSSPNETYELHNGERTIWSKFSLIRNMSSSPRRIF